MCGVLLEGGMGEMKIPLGRFDEMNTVKIKGV